MLYILTLFEMFKLLSQCRHNINLILSVPDVSVLSICLFKVVHDKNLKSQAPFKEKLFSATLWSGLSCCASWF